MVVVFDLGGVMIDWNPRYLFRKLFNDSNEMEFFLNDICNHQWNIQQDAGRPFAEAVAQLSEKHPIYKDMIEAYYERWQEMLAEPIHKSVQLFYELKAKGYRVLGLTNWSHETFPIAMEKFKFLKDFDGILVSGEEKMAKPDAAIFHLLCERFQVASEECFFIDDSLPNVEAAKNLGFQTFHFQNSHDAMRSFANLEFPSYN